MSRNGFVSSSFSESRPPLPAAAAIASRVPTADAPLPIARVPLFRVQKAHEDGPALHGCVGSRRRVVSVERDSLRRAPVVVVGDHAAKKEELRKRELFHNVWSHFLSFVTLSFCVK